MEALLTRIAATDDADPSLLIQLIDTLRPRQKRSADAGRATTLWRCATCWNKTQSLRAGLRDYLLRIIATRKQSHLYADTGIFSGTDFMAEAKQRWPGKFCPLPSMIIT
jgi:site-specific recombinase